MLTQQWAQSFAVSPDDVEYIQGLLLEREVPLSLEEIARFLIERRLEEQQTALQEQYRGVASYRPADSYDIGQRLVFPRQDLAIASVVSVREGGNPDLGEFRVIQVEFEDHSLREYASALGSQHKLNDDSGSLSPVQAGGVSADALLDAHRDSLYQAINEALAQSQDLVRLSGRWFSRALMLDVHEGHLNLAEAVLDMNGAPLTTLQILEQIGGLDGGTPVLQEFCLNDALNADSRFDEVGPLDTVLWHLRRLEPAEVQQTPIWLRYTPAAYDMDSLTPEQHALEREIDDEWSDLPLDSDQESDRVRLILSYPHQRAGTLPLASRMQSIFPTARSSNRIAFTLVDGQDGEEFAGWVVRQGRYVYGLKAFYDKHRLPIGTLITVHRESGSDKVVVDFLAHRPRTEWVRMMIDRNGQIGFEDHKRPIGAEYDDLMLLGADDQGYVDGLFQNYQQGRRPLSALLKPLVTELSRNMPQGAVHAKTLYSALNMLRRCPPGPLFAALNGEPDFYSVGNHYWRLGNT
ncbi:MAG: hypothetical protein JNL42_09695 [Anaerolineae bacterium]|nr:hypothetical protein [Anaerolineae bacterium]